MSSPTPPSNDRWYTRRESQDRLQLQIAWETAEKKALLLGYNPFKKVKYYCPSLTSTKVILVARTTDNEEVTFEFSEGGKCTLRSQIDESRQTTSNSASSGASTGPLSGLLRKLKDIKKKST